jgi:hypothetical protein
MSQRVLPFVLVAFGFLALPSLSLAQSAIAGAVKDTTGAVLPGVTVEASSPALIEKVKTATTNEAGQYRIVDLRPGTYTVTFTLTGFSTVVRPGVLLEANFVAPINVEMRVGAVSESITVTGESPIVDVQTSQRREVVSQQLLESLPTGRSYIMFANTIPSVTTGSFDVGGSSGMWAGGGMQVHGSLSNDSRTMIDGMVVDGMAGTGQCSCIYDNELQTQELAVQVSGGSAENQLSGVLVNRVGRSGGNTYSGDQMLLFSNGSLQSVNLDDDLIARGLRVPAKLYRQYDINYSLGGPILKNRLWFFISGRNWAYNNYVPNTFYKDGRQALDDSALKAFPLRLTGQVSRRNRVTALIDWSNKIKDHYDISATVSPEASARQDSPAAYIAQGRWTSTLSNHLLLEAGYSATHSGGIISYQPEVKIGTCHVAFNLCSPGTDYGDIPHVDTLLGINTVANAAGVGSGGGPAFRPALSRVAQASIAYVSGSHAIKVGFQHRSGWSEDRRPNTNADLNQQYRNGAPFAVQVLNTPIFSRSEVNADLGLYAQDTWTMKRLTLNPGVRWDYFHASVPEQNIGAGRFVPARHFDAIEDVPNWSNVVPRFGVAYDLTGRGRTAVKGTVGLYVQSQGPGFPATYNPMVAAIDTRTWTDFNGDDIAQENEIGPPTNLTFGIRRNQNMDPNIKRPYQMVWDLGIQHEVLPGLGVSVSYNQRSFYNTTFTDNLALDPSDYTLMTVPDPRNNGQVLPVYNINRAKFGQVNELDTTSDQNTRVYKGVDFSFNMRMKNGASLYGGTSTGRTLSVSCLVEDFNNLRFCDQTQYDVPRLTLFKLAGTYPLPYGVRFSGTFQHTPGADRGINYQVTRTLIPTLSQTSVNVRLNEPGSEFNDSINQVDLSITRGFRKGGIEARPELALFNLFNVNPVRTQNNTFGPSLGNVTAILNPRVLRLGLIVKF